jgi:hypothetical protein
LAFSSNGPEDPAGVIRELSFSINSAVPAPWSYQPKCRVLLANPKVVDFMLFIFILPQCSGLGLAWVRALQPAQRRITLTEL